MSIVTVDFETFYDKGFSLSRMTTEEYINDPRFEVIGVGIQIDDDEPQWYAGKEVGPALAAIDWTKSAVLCHNTQFDGAILAWRYGVVPEFYFDTLCMARAIHGVDAGGSLKALAERYKIGEKGNEVINALGKRLGDFSVSDLDNYGVYCRNDVALTRRLFDILAVGFPGSELSLIDMTLRMYTQPTLKVDDALLIQRLEEVKNEKSELLRGLMDRLKCDNEEDVRKKLASNPQFAALLEEHGVKPPMKTSPATGKDTFALAKNDEGFIALTEHEDPFIQQLCAVRLGTKSTIEESRVERFIGIGARNKGKLPIPLKYYGAHTGRWAGADAVNFQNLPSRDKKKKTLKKSVTAPEDHIVINCDSSQIEARVLAWLAGQNDVVKQFAKGEDVYSTFATKIYKKPISKDNPIERFVGKTCILGLGYGTGAVKLRHTLKTQPPGADIEEEESQRIVDLYRETNDKIVDLWRGCEYALTCLLSWPKEKAGEPKSPFYLGVQKCLIVDRTGLRLPNGLYIRYPELAKEAGKFSYASRKGRVSIWGGAVVENVVQALARIVVAEQMLSVSSRYRPVLTVHDAAVIVVPKAEQDQALAFITQVMSTPPDWATGLPVACEAKFGESYGDC
jgi:DNA polymerase I-like protein with 3'-5' exonuclease and polymerase domains